MTREDVDRKNTQKNLEVQFKVLIRRGPSPVALYFSKKPNTDICYVEFENHQFRSWCWVQSALKVETWPLKMRFVVVTLCINVIWTHTWFRLHSILVQMEKCNKVAQVYVPSPPPPPPPPLCDHRNNVWWSVQVMKLYQSQLYTQNHEESIWKIGVIQFGIHIPLLLKFGFDIILW
jgi:hypothetical protein